MRPHANQLIFAVFLLCCSYSWGAITLVKNDLNGGHVQCHGTGAGCQTPLIDTTGATLYVAILGTDTATGTIWDIIGTGNTNNSTSFNTWTCLAATHSSLGRYVQICYVEQPTPSPQTYFQLNDTHDRPGLTVSIWKGTDPSTAVIDVSNGNQTSSNVNSLTTGSIGPLYTSPELIVSGWTAGSTVGNSTKLSVTDGLSILDAVNGGGYSIAADAFSVTSATAALNPTWSVTGSAEDMATVIAAFKPMNGTPIYRYAFTSGVAASPNTETQIIANPITEVTGATMVCGVAAAQTPTSVSDANNTYTDIGTHVSYTNGSYNHLSVWYAANITGGTGLTPTAAISAGYGFILCNEYVNMQSSPFDSSAVATATNNAAGTTVTSGSFTTTFANDVIFAFASTATVGVQTFTAGTNFTPTALDYTAKQAGPGFPTTPYTDIWQGSETQDWIPNAIETGATSATTYTTSSNSGMIVAAFKGLPAAVSGGLLTPNGILGPSGIVGP
jgi:hypothetical protein